MKRALAGVLACWLAAWAMSVQAAGNSAALLGKGWGYYNEGRLAAAAAAFQNAARGRQMAISRNARLGLAYVRIRQSRLAEAEKVLRGLAAEGYRPAETLSRLVEVRIALNRFASAAEAAQNLPEPLRTEKQLEIADARLLADLGDGLDSPEAVAAFLDAHGEELTQCRRPELFFRAAGMAEPSASAGDIYRKLLKCPLAPELRESALENLAWHHYKHQDMAAAETHFTRLQQEHPGHRGAALGLGYIRLNTGRAATALEPLETAGVPDDPEILTLKRLVYTRLGWAHYEQGAWKSADDDARQALKITPQDRDARLLQAWVELKQGDTDQALAAFETIYRTQPNPENAMQLLDAQMSAGRTDAARKSAQAMALSGTPALRQRAADFFFNCGELIRAARLSDDATRCYANADTTLARMDGYFRHRDGDAGTSQLDEYALPMEVESVRGERSRVFMGATLKRLDSGKGPSPPPVGSFYRHLDGESRRNDLIEEETVLIPQVGFRTEGRLRWSGRLATTPIGAEIAPTVTGRLRLETDIWHLTVHRCSVTESILAATGLKDPYADRSWGRVVRSGITAGGVLPIGPHYWLSSTVSGERYNGDHVWDNDRISLDLAAGGTWQDQEGYEFSAGLFFFAQRFSRNSNFFTYGHGGYYSPAVMTTTGPFLRYRSPLCRGYGFDLQAAVGWLHEETDDSPRYPLMDESPWLLSASARAEALGVYEGETSNDMGYNLQAEVWHRLSDHLVISGFAAGERSSNHAEWKAGVGLRWYFRPQEGLWQHDPAITRTGNCSNR